MVELDGGIRRVTLALPLGIDHVHCYFLPASDGGWNLVDTGLGLPDAAESWRRVLDELGGPVAWSSRTSTRITWARRRTSPS